MPFAEKNPQFEALFEGLKQSRGFDFASYRRSSLQQLVSKRIEKAGVESFREPIRVLCKGPSGFPDIAPNTARRRGTFIRDRITCKPPPGRGVTRPESVLPREEQK